MRTKRRVKKIFWAIVIVLLAIIISLGVIIAEDLETLQGRRVDIQEQINHRNEQMAAVNERITETLDGISALDERIDSHERDLRVLDAQLMIITREIDDIEDQLRQVEESYMVQREAFERRLVAQYMAGETVYLDVLLRSNSLRRVCI